MTARSGRVESVSKAFILLEELNRQRVSSLQALHARTGLSKPTIVRLLKTLCDLGYAANDRRHGGYTITSRVHLLSSGFLGSPLVVEAARPWAVAFTQKHGWPVSLAVLDQTSMVVRFTTTPDSPMAPLQNMVNHQLSLLGRAMGRVYLAFCSDRERSALIRSLSQSSHVENRLAKDQAAAESMLSEIRKQGFAERHPTIDPGSGTIAVPLHVRGKLLASIGMTFYSSALPPSERINYYVPRLQDLSERIAESTSALRASMTGDSAPPFSRESHFTVSPDNPDHPSNLGSELAYSSIPNAKLEPGRL